MQHVRVLLPGAQAPPDAGLPDLNLPPAAFEADAFIIGRCMAPLASYPAHRLKTLSIYARQDTGQQHRQQELYCCPAGSQLLQGALHRTSAQSGLLRHCLSPLAILCLTAELLLSLGRLFMCAKHLKVQAGAVGVTSGDAQPTQLLADHVEQLVRGSPAGSAERVVLATAQYRYIFAVSDSVVLRAMAAASLLMAAGEAARWFREDAAQALAQAAAALQQAAQEELQANADQAAQEAQPLHREAAQATEAAQLWEGVAHDAHEALLALELQYGSWRISRFMHHQVGRLGG